MFLFAHPSKSTYTVDFLSLYSVTHRGQLTRWTSYPFIHSAIEVNQHGGLLIFLFTQP